MKLTISFERGERKRTPPPSPLTPERRLLRAWTDAGPVPRLHYKQVRRLHQEWPALASALDELSRKHATGRQQ